MCGLVELCGEMVMLDFVELLYTDSGGTVLQGLVLFG